jgi:hypothetical protein
MAPQLNVAFSTVLVPAHIASKKAMFIALAVSRRNNLYTDLGFDMVNVTTDYSALQYTLNGQLCLAGGEEKSKRTGKY